VYILLDNFDSFTYNVYQVMATLTDRPIKVYRNDAISLDEIEAMRPDGLIVSPGPGRPEDAGVSVAAIKRFAGKMPVLGICLGHQAIGYAFGARIVSAKRIVHGKAEEIHHDGRGLFRNLPSPSTFARYHSLAIDAESLPACLEATSFSADGEIMGVRHREFLVEGLQFHPESIASEQGRAVLRNFFCYRRDPFPFKTLLSQVAKGRDLERSQASAFMEELTDGGLSDMQISGFLMALEAKGVTADEIAGCAEVLRRKRIAVGHSKPALDTCGTGGDGLGTFNISSMAALVTAACGATTAKHGNRAVSSLSGSADFYGELGMNVSLSPAASAELLERSGFAFLFAPIYHGAMKYAAPARKALGVKTIMNLLGPLANPCAAEYQVIGIHDPALLVPVARAASMLGVRRVMTVHSDDGMDEISPFCPTRVAEMGEDGELKEYSFDPRSAGVEPDPHGDLAGGSASRNVEMARRLLAEPGAHPALRDAVALNAGAGLYVCGLAESLESGYRAAMAALADGRVAKKLEEVVSLSKVLS
jgi:anthranilate synthase/phosphoribosyltransferase